MVPHGVSQTPFHSLKQQPTTTLLRVDNPGSTLINNMTVTPGTTSRKPKRIYPICAHEGCNNRVVQGGVCFTVILIALAASPLFAVSGWVHPTRSNHGAKRKLCSFPRCNINRQRRVIVSNVEAGESSLVMALSSKRYGPMDDRTPPATNDVHERNRLKSNFTQLLNTIIYGNTPENEYPSLFTQYIDTVMKVIGYSNHDNRGGGSLLDEILQEAVLQSNDDDSTTTSATTTAAAANRVDQISDAINLILTFVESFVEETKSMDDVYKQLLGKIFQSIAPSASPSNDRATSITGAPSIPTSSTSVANMELQLDNLLSSEKAAFTPGFLRHVEGECIRISSLSTISPESVKMLQILKLIQTRVLEELGKVSFFSEAERAVEKENG